MSFIVVCDPTPPSPNGVRSLVLFCFGVAGHVSPQYYRKSSRHGHTPVDGRDNIYIQRSRTPFVFEICLVPSQSVFDTDMNGSWHTSCHVSVCRTFVSAPHCTLPYRCTSEVQCSSARSLSPQLVAFHLLFFLRYFFVGCDPQMYTIGGCLVMLRSLPRLLYYNWLLIRSRTPIRCQEQLII